MRTIQAPRGFFISRGRSVLFGGGAYPFPRAFQVAREAPSDLAQVCAEVPTLLRAAEWALRTPEALSLLLRTPEGTALASELAQALVAIKA